jgi:hypothetical protein
MQLNNVHPLPQAAKVAAGIKELSPKEKYEKSIKLCTGRYVLCLKAAQEAFAEAGVEADTESLRQVATTFFIECNRSQRL